MSTRKGPSKSATLFKEGIVKKGNDGNKWIIVTNKLGVRRWQKMGSNSNKTTQKIKSKSKTKSIRVLQMEADPNTVWGKNKPLQELWQSLASGEKVVLIEKGGKYNIFTMPTGKVTIRKMYDSFNDDENIIAILSSNMSQDAYEVYLYPKAKDKSVEYVIKNYKKYFKSFDESQKKVLYPA